MGYDPFGVVVIGFGPDKGDGPGQMIALRPRDDSLTSRRWTHIVDPQIQRRGKRAALVMAGRHRPARRVDQRRDRTPMDDPGLCIPDKIRVPRQGKRGPTGTDIDQFYRQSPTEWQICEVLSDLFFEADHDPLSFFAGLICVCFAQVQPSRDRRLRRWHGLRNVMETGGRAMAETRLSFKEMCAKFDVTARTLRYYEYIELLQPKKDGRARTFGPREIARMTLILRGRRWGFALEEIRQWLLIYEEKGTTAQMEALVDLATRQLKTLREQRTKLDEAIEELRKQRDDTAAKLRENA